MGFDTTEANVASGWDEQTAARCAHHPLQSAARSCERCGTFACIACLSGELCRKCAEEHVEPPRIGGLLILPLIGLFAMPLGFAAQLVGAGAAIAQAGLDAAIEDGPWLFTTGWNVLIAAVQACMALYILPKFFKKLRVVPRLMVCLYALAMVLSVVSFVIERSQDWSATVSPFGAILPRFGLAFLWISYFLKSDRVKRTFIVGPPPKPSPFFEVSETA